MIVSNINKSNEKVNISAYSLEPGNIVPHNWYHTLLRPCGKSDTTAITILSELVFLHRYNGATEFQLNFAYFARKFNFGLSQVKDAVIRLEKLSLLKRDLRTIIVQGRRFTNEMFLLLNISNVLKLNPNNKTFDQNNSNGSLELELKKFPLSGRKERTSSLEFSSDNKIKRENNKKSRSAGSNFNSNNSLVKELGSTNRRFGFSSFYPLGQADIDTLRRLSSREFSSNAINEILLSLSRKLPNHDFPHKKAFINYMAKALSYEMRDAVKISNESFRIKSNISSRDTNFKQQVPFLSHIEESTDTTLAAQLSHKLASILPPDLAYNFLLAAKFPAHAEENSFGISLQKNIDLSEMQYRLILEQVQSVYGSFISSLEFIIKNQEIPTSVLSPAAFSVGNNESEMFLRVWGRIRAGLIKTCGEGIDRNWFSKLTANIDEERGEIKLQAPTLFIRDWIQRNYQHLLERFCNKENYRLMEITV
ncbi:chromosomal replication initiator protein DnaA-like protein (plasmid) [Candidatus Megaera polyxenophila]|nr:chromosomal replication initiator protein DnaA-like protein [Candidatus Megaera polyxenophila]